MDFSGVDWICFMVFLALISGAISVYMNTPEETEASPFGNQN